MTTVDFAAWVTPDLVIPLGKDVHARMVADGVPDSDIDRVAVYALHYWARGKIAADWVAETLWGTRSGGEGGAPKAPRRSRSGRSTGSASRTQTASTPTTASPPS